MFPYLPQVKLAGQIFAGLGVSKILGDVIKNNVVITTTFQKVTVHAGTFVLGSMLIDQSSKHIEQNVDLVANWIASRKTEETPATKKK
jgi:hypothetical protein